MQEATAFGRLDERIQRFIWNARWETLHEVQERAIEPMLNADRDLILAAPTASGKTEAAFLPALTRLLATDEPGLIVYISPLKALINDQFRRLEGLCEDLDVPVWPWHGDIGAGSKTKFLRKPSGVLLITPESLEALFCNRGTSVAALFKHTLYAIVDELHAFIGSERGKQLQALLHRIEAVLERRVVRVGLSATLGDMTLAAQFLRPSGDALIIDCRSSGSGLKVLVKGFEDPPPVRGPDHDGGAPSHREIASQLYACMRGTNNMVFPNSRSEVEHYTHMLHQLCGQHRAPNEFWPHHGNLSKEIRHETEAALKDGSRPATVICTNTLELGIDIGAIKSVAQIGRPPSVASLRQRLGRSGRRPGEFAILRGFVTERRIDQHAALPDRLRLTSFHMAAVIDLLIEGWFEPPAAHGAHLSTLIQQLLSAIAQYGGLSAAQAWQLLCAPGAPFANVGKPEFVALLRHLGEQRILQGESSGLLLHGSLGEKIVNHYSFYAAFASDEEFRIVAGDRTLGTLPVSQLVTRGQRILFAGRPWIVEAVEEEQLTIHVRPAPAGGAPPFPGSGSRVHSHVRQRMRDLYESVAQPIYLDPVCLRFLGEGRAAYATTDVREGRLIEQGDRGLLVTWQGDSVNEALACLAGMHGLEARAIEIGVDVKRPEDGFDGLQARLIACGEAELPGPDELLGEAKNLRRAKWDWALPDSLLRSNFAHTHLDVGGARHWLNELARRNGHAA